ncbi:MAG: hypothetical protein LBP53_04485 [Candidatus Peribacteria bacterium]|nr:hypothetical protein [Candidatus Peribacteria bacterium]
MGIIAEKLKDEKGLVRPEHIAPYDYYIVPIGNETMTEKADYLAHVLEKKGYAVMVDDRAVSPGVKMRDSELFGIPQRIVISQKSLEAGGYEYQKRTSEEKKIVQEGEL